MIIKDILDKDNDELIIALSYIIDKSKTFIYTNPYFELKEAEVSLISQVEDKIKDGYPLQYAIGKWEFYGLEFNVDQRALIPRFETEIIVDYLINKAVKKDRILDIGAGSGAISLALAQNLKSSSIIGVDIEDAALSLAEENKDKFNLSNVDFIKSDLFENIDQTFDIIISNPPYISQDDYDNLDKKLYYEPKSALVGGLDGLDFYRDIIKDANIYLNDGGYIVFEIGYDQKDEVIKLLIESDFKNIEALKDFNGFDRFIVAQKG